MTHHKIIIDSFFGKSLIRDMIFYENFDYIFKENFALKKFLFKRMSKLGKNF